jgi:hypothetical protein
MSSFFFGIVIGAAALYGAMHYHVVHSSDGFHVIARLTPSLTNPYVDVRKFTPADWQKHHELAMASLRANKGKVVQEPAPQASVLINDKSNFANW